MATARVRRPPPAAAPDLDPDPLPCGRRGPVQLLANQPLPSENEEEENDPMSRLISRARRSSLDR